MAVLLVDLDEVLFPFAFAYAAFRERRGLPPVPAAAWAGYEINERSVPGHQALMGEFFTDPVTCATPPIADAVRVLQPLAGRHELLGCTSRYEVTEGPGTAAWVAAHVPWLAGVRFTGWHPESGRPSSKPAVAAQLRAAVLLDDCRVHLRGLPSSTRGLLVRRPDGVPSESGALPWDQVAMRLAGLAD